jgi:hypothetical protein
MSPAQVWTFTYVSVLAMRLHPRNGEDLQAARTLAIRAAELALFDFQEAACRLHQS